LLLDELELDRVDLVGHDWGGWIAFLLGLRRPERIGRSVALTIVPPWPSGDRRGVLEAWRIAYQIPLALPQLGRRAVEPRPARAPRGVRCIFGGRDRSLHRSPEGRAGPRSELLYRTLLLREAVPVSAGRYAGVPFEVPTLLLVGARDAVTPTRAVREQASGADALELELVPEAGHFIVDEKPELVADRTLGSFRA
jgi:pimeloyl-ACP methyl ester carboxylesterase